MELGQVRTVADFQQYLRDHPSSVVTKVLKQAICFFSDPCNREDGRPDMEALKERGRFGLRFRLDSETELSGEVVDAFRRWFIHSHRGAIGTSFQEVMASHTKGDTGNPREEIHRILDILRGVA
jgi:hypothetical protein